MSKYRKTICQDEGFTKGMWYYSPIDLRKKYYHCGHCQKEYLVKKGLVKNNVGMGLNGVQVQICDQDNNPMYTCICGSPARIKDVT